MLSGISAFLIRAQIEQNWVAKKNSNRNDAFEFGLCVSKCQMLRVGSFRSFLRVVLNSPAAPHEIWKNQTETATISPCVCATNCLLPVVAITFRMTADFAAIPCTFLATLLSVQWFCSTRSGRRIVGPICYLISIRLQPIDILTHTHNMSILHYPTYTAYVYAWWTHTTCYIYDSAYIHIIRSISLSLYGNQNSLSSCTRSTGQQKNGQKYAQNIPFTRSAVRLLASRSARVIKCNIVYLAKQSLALFSSRLSVRSLALSLVQLCAASLARIFHKWIDPIRKHKILSILLGIDCEIILQHEKTIHFPLSETERPTNVDKHQHLQSRFYSITRIRILCAT